jgi:hypothetical protein
MFFEGGEEDDTTESATAAANRTAQAIETEGATAQARATVDR